MNNPMNLLQMLGQLKSNPRALLQSKFNYPQNLNNPNEILQHLMNTGQVTQAQYNNAMEMAKKFQK